VWCLIDNSLPPGHKRDDLLATPVCRELAIECVHIDYEKVPVYIALVIGRNLFFTEKLIECLRQQGPTDDATVERGSNNLRQMRNMGPEEHRAIFEAMLHEVTSPTKASGTLAAWIREGCRERCGDYHIPDKASQQVLTTTSWVYSQQSSHDAAPSQATPGRKPPGLSEPERGPAAFASNASSYGSFHDNSYAYSTGRCKGTGWRWGDKRW
jgi:hypothetical protein